MITVIGKDDLKNALERPEEYKDLIIRVGGFSARFVDLNKDVQQEILIVSPIDREKQSCLISNDFRFMMVQESERVFS